MADGDLYAFGPFALAPRERRLTREGVAVPLTPKCFDLLVVLIENRGSLVTKTALMESLWPDRFVDVEPEPYAQAAGEKKVIRGNRWKSASRELIRGNPRLAQSTPRKSVLPAEPRHL